MSGAARDGCLSVFTPAQCPAHICCWAGYCCCLAPLHLRPTLPESHCCSLTVHLPAQNYHSMYPCLFCSTLLLPLLLQKRSAVTSSVHSNGCVFCLIHFLHTTSLCSLNSDQLASIPCLLQLLFPSLLTLIAPPGRRSASPHYQHLFPLSTHCRRHPACFSISPPKLATKSSPWSPSPVVMLILSSSWTRSPSKGHFGQAQISLRKFKLGLVPKTVQGIDPFCSYKSIGKRRAHKWSKTKKKRDSGYFIVAKRIAPPCGICKKGQLFETKSLKL
jgi:hypothetical protein